MSSLFPPPVHVEVGWTVKAFDPRTLGVVKHGKVTTIRRTSCTIDFGLTGKCQVSLRDIVEVVDTRAEA